MTQHNLPELLADFNRYFTSSNGVDVPARVSVPRDEWRALHAALSSQGAGEAVAGKWDGAEEWMPLAWELCADECGEESCTELVWEGGPIPEPWGDRWLKYEDEAKRLIALVRKHTRPQVAQPPLKATETMIDAAIANADKFSGKGWRATYAGIYEAMAEAAQPARVVDDMRGIRPPMCRISGVSQGVLERAARSTPPAAPILPTVETSANAGSSPIQGSRVPTPSQQADHSPDGGNMVGQQAGEVTELELFEEWIEQEAGKGALKKWPNEHGTSYENLRVCDYRTGWLAALAAFEAKKAGV